MLCWSCICSVRCPRLVAKISRPKAVKTLAVFEVCEASQNSHDHDVLYYYCYCYQYHDDYYYYMLLQIWSLFIVSLILTICLCCALVLYSVELAGSTRHGSNEFCLKQIPCLAIAIDPLSLPAIWRVVWQGRSWGNSESVIQLSAHASFRSKRIMFGLLWRMTIGPIGSRHNMFPRTCTS